MTLLEYAEKTSTIPLTAWQKEFVAKYEQSVKEGRKLDINMVPNVGRKMVQDTMDLFRGTQPTEIYCQGTKKKGIPCKRYLGKLHSGKVELLCPICKTVNVVEENNYEKK